MIFSHDTRRRLAIGFELLAAGAIVMALLGAIAFFRHNGYLPPPFFHDPDDTFMDWYNTTYWAYEPGAYSDWSSVYPPLSFVFSRIFSIGTCFSQSADSGRHCDKTGFIFITVMFLVNIFVAWKVYRKQDRATSVARTIALGLGMPALFAWERGNLIIPCLTALMLCHGRIVRSSWMRAIMFAVTVNLKPYLLLTETGSILKGRWVWLERAAISSVALYAFSYAVIGAGTPSEILYNIRGFTQAPLQFSINTIEYSSTYISLLQVLKSTLPLLGIVGSRPVEFLQAAIPIGIGGGAAGVFLCFLLALLRPKAFTGFRLSALSMALLLSVAPSPGGYADVFLLFFVFLEPFRGPGAIVALIAAYGLSLPWDVAVAPIAHVFGQSYLSSQTVGYDLGVNLGELLRPGLMLLIECGLVLQSIIDCVKWRGRETAPSEARPGASAIPITS